MGRLTESAWQQRAVLEQRLLLGQSRQEAISDLRRDAVRTGLIPIINAMAAAGIVSLPGMMTGQILAGSPPVEAVKYHPRAGVLNLMRAMCIDHGEHNIRVNVVCPGDVDTPMLRSECEQLGGTYDDRFKAECAERPLALPTGPRRTCSWGRLPPRRRTVRLRLRPVPLPELARLLAGGGDQLPGQQAAAGA